MPPATKSRKPRRKARPDRTMLVRIYPRAPKRGHHCASFVVRDSPYGKFLVEVGWYTVRESFAENLRKYRNNDRDPMSPPIFQICTQEEARAIEEAEKEAIRRADANTPIPLPKTEMDDEDWEIDEEEEEASDEPDEPKDLADYDEADYDEADYDDDDYDDEPPEAPVAEFSKKTKVSKKASKKAKKVSKKATKKKVSKKPRRSKKK